MPSPLNTPPEHSDSSFSKAREVGAGAIELASRLALNAKSPPPVLRWAGRQAARVALCWAIAFGALSSPHLELFNHSSASKGASEGLAWVSSERLLNALSDADTRRMATSGGLNTPALVSQLEESQESHRLASGFARRDFKPQFALSPQLAVWLEFVIGARRDGLALAKPNIERQKHTANETQDRLLAAQLALDDLTQARKNTENPLNPRSAAIAWIATASPDLHWIGALSPQAAAQAERPEFRRHAGNLAGEALGISFVFGIPIVLLLGSAGALIGQALRNLGKERLARKVKNSESAVIIKDNSAPERSQGSAIKDLSKEEGDSPETRLLAPGSLINDPPHQRRILERQDSSFKPGNPSQKSE